MDNQLNDQMKEEDWCAIAFGIFLTGFHVIQLNIVLSSEILLLSNSFAIFGFVVVFMTIIPLIAFTVFAASYETFIKYEVVLTALLLVLGDISIAKEDSLFTLGFEKACNWYLNLLSFLTNFQETNLISPPFIISQLVIYALLAVWYQFIPWGFSYETIIQRELDVAPSGIDNTLKEIRTHLEKEFELLAEKLKRRNGEQNEEQNEVVQERSHLNQAKLPVNTSNSSGQDDKLESEIENPSGDEYKEVLSRRNEISDSMIARHSNLEPKNPTNPSQLKVKQKRADLNA